VRDTRGVRATGLQGDLPTEIIEILDDDSDIFGDRAANTTIHDGGGPRWVGPVAAAALVALIGYGVATSSSKSGVPQVASAPSTTSPPPTTAPAPAPTTTIPPPIVPYYAAEPPREFSVEWADIHPPDSNYYGNGAYELWAKTGATAASGSWFSIESYSGSLQGIYAPDAYRVANDQQSIAISHMTSGQSVAQFTEARLTAVTLTSFGLSDEELVQLVTSVNVGRDGVELTDPSLITDYRMLSEVPPWLAVQGNPAEEIYYSAGDDPVGGFGIIVSPRTAPSEGGGTFDRQTALRFFLDHATPFDVDGHVAVAGSVIGQQDFAIATWIANDHIVTVSASMPVQQLIAIARTVHEVSVDEWSGMQFQAAARSGRPFEDYEETTPLPISTGTDANAQEWTIEVSMATMGDQRQVSWRWDDNGFGAALDGKANIHTVVDSKRTYVLAELPRSIAPTAQLQIIRAGLDPIVVEFADTDLSFDRTFAAYAFSEPTQYTAQIIGEDGAVLANWPAG
jgi:hypothetical protein